MELVELRDEMQLENAQTVQLFCPLFFLVAIFPKRGRNGQEQEPNNEEAA